MLIHLKNPQILTVWIKPVQITTDQNTTVWKTVYQPVQHQIKSNFKTYL
jgi:hypothetical protein